MIVWTPRARANRTAIIDYIAEKNPQAALDMLDEMEAKTDMLDTQAEIGRPGRVKGTRELVIGKTIIEVYRVRPRLKRVEILRVLHTAQDYK
jgi:toxin ParE1/3/4